MATPVDRLDALLQRFSLSARMFHSGALCGITDFAAGATGMLHLVSRGAVEVHHGARRVRRIAVPSLVFYPRPHAHRFVTDPAHGADMACAHVAFDAGERDPVALALPPLVILPLAEVEGAAPVLDVLFREAFTRACGRRRVVDRLFEVVVILILRALLNGGHVASGMLAGLSHPRLARAIVAMHDSPARAWTLDALAKRAGLSRSQFAAVFADVVGTTPGDYLAGHRIAVAQDLLRRGRPVKVVATEVGYGSASALSRAFTAHCGRSPREWLAAAREVPAHADVQTASSR